MVAAGWREEGSHDDFYETLAHAVRSARARYNTQHTPPLTTDTDVTQWLPSDADQDRFAAEGAVRPTRSLHSIQLNYSHTEDAWRCPRLRSCLTPTI